MFSIILALRILYKWMNLIEFPSMAWYFGANENNFQKGANNLRLLVIPNINFINFNV
jgi:hypothetical protein